MISDEVLGGQILSKITEAGGIECIINAMDTFKTCRQLQIYACCALRNLAESADNQITIQKAGGIERIVAAATTLPITPASDGKTLNRRANDALHRLAHIQSAIRAIRGAIRRHCAIRRGGGSAVEEEDQL